MVQEMGEPSTPPSIYNCPMNVLVEGVPSAAGDPTTIEYYLSSLTHVKCEVTQHGRSFLAKFQQKIGKAVSNKLLVYHPKSLKKSERGGGFFFYFLLFFYKF